MFQEINDLHCPKSLGSDNHSGVHPQILNAIIAANQGHAHSYGMDPLSDLAQNEFDRVFKRKSHVFYVFNGTAANVISLASSLKSFEAVLCSEVSHLNLDECSSPEVIGRTKLIGLPSQGGKIFPQDAEKWMDRQGDQHHAQIKMVSLTQPTELGECYGKHELLEWKSFCQKHGLILHCDGARLANSCHNQGIPLDFYGEIFDLISLGGTKNGLLGAEAVVVFEKELAKDFKFYRKQMLNLPSKTRFLAAQFYAYLKNDLYLDIAKKVCEEALSFSTQLKKHPEVEILYKVQSNAVFVKFPKEWLKPLREPHFFYIWDVRTGVARLMIGYDWNKEDTDSFLENIRRIKNVQLS